MRERERQTDRQTERREERYGTPQVSHANQFEWFRYEASMVYTFLL